MSAQLAGTARRYRWAVMGIAALVLLLAGFLIGSARAGVSLHGPDGTYSFDYEVG